MLNDTISKVENLNAVQQLTATITPPSVVNMMTNNEDRCFQCQEHSHIARHCPNIRCFDCDEYGHFVMDCPYKISPVGTPAKHHQSKLHKSHHATSSSRHCFEDRDRQSHSRSQPHFTDTTAQVVRIPIEAILDHNIGIIAIITEVAHTTQILHTELIAIDLIMTLQMGHTPDHLHTEAHHSTPEIEACHVHIHPTNPHDKTHIGHTHTPVDHKANHITKGTPE